MLKAKAAVKGLSKGCGKLCISGDCPHGDVISCGDDASPNEAPENYVVWVNGHFSSNAALKDIQKITDISDDLDVSSGDLHRIYVFSLKTILSLVRIL